MDTKARATACALAGGLVLSSGIGLALGGAYWLGENAQAEAAQARALRLKSAAAKGFSARALGTEIQAMDPGAVALAERQVRLGAQTPHALQVAEAVASSSKSPQPTMESPATIQPARLSHARGPAAQPFRFADGGAVAAGGDLGCLTDAVYYEARGESAAGQAAVAQVVLNRVRHPAFPKSVCGVVFQRGHGGYGCQFSFVCDGAMRHQREPDAWRRAEAVAAQALSGAVMATIGNATHFHVAGLHPGWGPNLLRVAQVGLHVFYRFGGRAGGPDSFTAGAEHSAAAAGDPTLPTADGAPTGQFILASALTAAPALTSGVSATGSPVTPAPAAAISPRAAPSASEKTERAPTPTPAPVSQAHPAPLS